MQEGTLLVCRKEGKSKGSPREVQHGVNFADLLLLKFAMAAVRRISRVRGV